MTKIQQSSAIRETFGNFSHAFAVVEIKWYNPLLEKIETLFLRSVKLTEVYGLHYVNRNQAWRKIVDIGTEIDLFILYTGNLTECNYLVSKLLQNLPAPPPCNISTFGVHTTKGMPIRCMQNNTVYKSQAAAANALSIAQSHISRHLSGRQTSVSGYTFEYMDRDETRKTQIVQQIHEISKPANPSGLPPTSAPPMPAPYVPPMPVAAPIAMTPQAMVTSRPGEDWPTWYNGEPCLTDSEGKFHTAESNPTIFHVWNSMNHPERLR